MYESDEGLSYAYATDHHKGWSASGTMQSGDVSKTVSLQAVFKDPGTYTASFTFEPLDDLTVMGVSPVTCEATLEWSVAGNTVTRKVSVNNGVSIQGTAEGVRIVVKDTTDKTIGGGITGIRYVVNVLVSKGPRGSFETPPILKTKVLPIQVLAAGTAIVPIPVNAGVKTVLVMVSSLLGAPIAEQTARVRQLDTAGNQLAVYDPRAIVWAPIAPGATQIELKNMAAPTLLFTVFFGVDG